MAKNGGLTYPGVKNEHILVCPLCGSGRYWKRVRNYKINRYFCRHCKKGFNQPENLQNWLMKRFEEARKREE